MFANYLKIALRRLLRQKFTTAINVIGLGIGISACLLIFLLVHFEFSYDTFHKNSGRIFRVVSIIDNPTGEKVYVPHVPFPAAWMIAKNFSGVEKTASFIGYSARVSIPQGGNREKKFEVSSSSETIITEPSYFDLFHYEWLEGNQRTSLAQPFQIVLTESRARQYFGSLPLNEIIGKEVVYDDSLRLVVSGIVKDWRKNSDLIFKNFISFTTIQSSFLKEDDDLQFATRPDRWGAPDQVQTFVKLSKGTTVDQFESQTVQMVKEHMTHKEDYGKIRITLQPLSNLHFDANYIDFYSRKANLSALYTLLGIAVFILLIAAVNFINLSTAQSLSRAKDIGMRKVLGSKRSSIIFQFLTETFLIICISVAFSLLFVFFALKGFSSLVPNGIHLDLADPSALLFLLCTIFLTCVLSGLYPATALSAYLPLETLKAKGVSRHRGYLRKGLIVFQFTISLVFIIGAVVVRDQTNFLLNKDLGFAKKAIISISTSDNCATDTRNALADRIRRLHGVDMVSVCTSAPMNSNNRSEENLLELPGTSRKVECSVRTGDEYYIPLFDLKLIAGRNFNTPKDDTVGFIPGKTKNYIIAPKYTEIVINETCSKQLGFGRPQDALGHIVQTPSPYYPVVKGPIVGVVADFHTQSLLSPMRPTYVYGSKNLPNGAIQVKVSSQDMKLSQLESRISAIENTWRSVYPDEPFSYRFFDQYIEQLYNKELMMAEVVDWAMFISVFVSCMGLFGLVTFSVAQRMKEISIRKVLGASVGNIIFMLSKDFLQLVVLSFAIASPIAYYYLYNWLERFAYRITIGWWVFILAGSFAILIAMITISFRIVKAALAAPIKSLRSE